MEIYSTLDYGAVLVLDSFTNLAESDLSYTHALMCHGSQVRQGRVGIGLGLGPRYMYWKLDGVGPVNNRPSPD